MQYLALATDYDGTLAQDGAVDVSTRDALVRLAATGRKLILVTGREIDDLATVFPNLALFDRIVAENGAVLLSPASGEIRVLGQPPPAALIDELKRRGVTPLVVGRVIVATRLPQLDQVAEAIANLSLDWQIVLNKGAFMVLPAGLDKATGLQAALDDLRLPPLAVVGVGDAENDLSMLDLCGLAVAVDNALPAVKDYADLVTGAARGAGVVELIDALVRDDLASLAGPRGE